ncbi:chitotriosidase-1 isoform X1 [Diabrotica virgifera virgifera]|nr:chitotriosidase-1 isoform X1 [Diabrotica virgifera virgifera]
MKWCGIIVIFCVVLGAVSCAPTNFTSKWHRFFYRSNFLLNNLNIVCGNVICYYTGSFGIKVAPPESIDTNLCTHLNYAFVKINENGTLIHNKYVDIKKEMYKRVASLKKMNPKLKILISIGDTPAAVFSEVAADPDKRHSLIQNTIDFLRLHGFDGVDVDWEKPYSKDEENFIHLLKEFKKALETKNYLLSVAVYPYPDAGYIVPKITENVDMINIMCYNFYGPWSIYTGHNAALFASPVESAYERNHLNTAMGLQNWLKAGATKEKVNVGIPFYGRTFTLADPNDHGFHAPITGSGKPSTATYRQICSNFANYTSVWDDTQKVYYKYYEDQWLTYEEERSVKEKAKYIRSQNVAGAMIWQIGQDDINGECGPKQGLLQVVNKYLHEDNN